jgi:hypothetical protein
MSKPNSSPEARLGVILDVRRVGNTNADDHPFIKDYRIARGHERANLPAIDKRKMDRHGMPYGFGIVRNHLDDGLTVGDL